MSQTQSSGLSLKSFGPGLLMASAAIGGSHLIASTKAGAIYGWQLIAIILLVNLFKYPFFKYSVDYTYDNGHSLVEGYARKSKAYLTVFFILIAFSAVINTSALGMLSAVILKTWIPAISLSVPVLAAVLLLISWLITIVGHYQALDKVTKLIVISLTICTIIAVAVAASKGAQVQPDFVATSAWQWAALPFIIILMGWMPAPIDVSAINSMWITAKQEHHPVSKQTAMTDFNVGYIGTALLAIVFLALGALVLYGTGEEIGATGFKFVPQLIGMYANTIGGWAQPLVAFIAFACIFGTTITVVDGYGRVASESHRLFAKKPTLTRSYISGWITLIVLVCLLIIFKFAGQLKDMLDFAMIAAFVSAPIFAWLNFSLVRKTGKVSSGLMLLSWLGLAFLSIFTIIFILFKAGMLS